jgi:hypothetical protein
MLATDMCTELPFATLEREARMTLGLIVPFPGGGARPPEAVAQTPVVEKDGIAFRPLFPAKRPL